MKILLLIIFYIVLLPIALILFGIARVLGIIYLYTNYKWSSYLIDKIGKAIELYSSEENKIKINY